MGRKPMGVGNGVQGGETMLSPQFKLPLHHKLVVDLFAGGGGASTGIEQAIGRAVDIAVNHDPEAIALHTANHPQTTHYISDVFEVDPLVVTNGQPIGLLWASPDCKHFSKAKGGKPVSKKIRSLAGVVIKWANLPLDIRPDVICLENVEEFQTWGPLIKRKITTKDEAGNTVETWGEFPCDKRKGQTFKRWVASLRKLGYVVEWKELRACDFGAPTIRKRLFLVARCDGLPIVWPEPTHAAADSLPARSKKLKPWRTAAECIDWSIPAPSIFERNKPLAEATCRRIAKGLQRYVMEAANPFIVSLTHQGGDRTEAITEPFKTITGAHRGEKALIVPTMIQTGYGERPGQAPRVPGLEKPIGTLVGGQKHALVQAFLTKFRSGSVGTPMDEPIHTVTAGGTPVRASTGNVMGMVTAHMVTIDNNSSKGGHTAATEPLKTTVTENRHALVTSNLIKLRGTNVGSATDEPLHTISAQGTHHAEVRAFLIKYYGTDQDPRLTEPMHTVPTKDRFGLVTIHGTEYAIVDIGLRMLTPRELYRAQGFPEDYLIDIEANGKPLTKTAQVRMCGNSVCPPMSRAIVAANYSENYSEGRKAA